VIWFIAIVVMWIATTVVGAIEASNASPSALIHPSNYEGQICGIDSEVINKPYGYYVNTAMEMVCLDECPSKTASIDLDQNAYNNMICKSDEISDSYKNADIDSSKYYDYDALFADGSGNCNYEIETFAVLYYCVFDPEATLPNITSNEITFDDDGDDDTDYFSGNYKISEFMGIDADSSSGYMMEFIQDLYTCRAQIFGFGLMIALLIAFVYTFLLTLGIVYVIVWSSIGGTLLFILALGAYLYETSQEWDAEGTHSESSVLAMEVIGIIFLAMGGLYICLMICICSKINLSCELVNVAGRCVRDVPVIVFFPLVKLAGLLAFLAPWMYYMVCLYSQGSYVVEEADDAFICATCTNISKTWEWDAVDTEAEIFFMFSYFWTSEFITALGQLIMALVFSKWYFTENDSESVEVDVSTGEETNVKKKGNASTRGNFLFFEAMCGGIWYHAGTAAFGSLIIAVIKTIRYILYKIQAQCNKRLSGVAKKIANIVLCCMQCCLYCIEKCMKYINKHAYIITAVRGNSFCPAAMKAFWLIARNIRLIFALALVSEYVIFIGKMLIIFGTGCLSYVYMERSFTTEVNSLAGPCLMVMVLAYFTAGMFMSVYSMAIDTMLHCYIADKEMNEHPFFTRDSCSHLKELHKKVEKYKIKDKKKDVKKDKDEES